MKKLICLFLLFLAVKANAQNDIVFKMRYLPAHIYNATTNMAVTANVTLKGDQKLLDQLKSRGVTSPVSLKMTMNKAGKIKTGAATGNGYPVVLSSSAGSVSLTVNEKAIPVPEKSLVDLKIYLHSSPEGKISMDSAGRSKMKDTSQKAVAQIMNSVFNQIRFPDRPIHIGDTFTQNMPMDMPVAGNNITMNINIIYKLVSVSDGKGFFDIKQNVDMKIPMQENTLNMTALGTGKLVYSIKDKFPTSMKSNLNLKFDGILNSLNINGTATINSDQKYVIGVK